MKSIFTNSIMSLKRIQNKDKHWLLIAGNSYINNQKFLSSSIQMVRIIIKGKEEIFCKD